MHRKVRWIVSHGRGSIYWTEAILWRVQGLDKLGIDLRALRQVEIRAGRDQLLLEPLDPSTAPDRKTIDES